MFLKSNNLNIFTKLYKAETFKGLPHPWASPSKSRLWNCTIQIFLGSEKKVISFSMKNKCTYEKIALCVWLCTVYTLHVIQNIWRSLQNHMKKKAFSANICMVILRRFFQLSLNLNNVPDFLPYSEHRNWASFPELFLDQSKYRASWHGVCRSSNLRLYWNLFIN